MVVGVGCAGGRRRGPRALRRTRGSEDGARARLRDDRVRTDGEPSLEWLHSKRDDAEVKRVLTSFKGVGPKTVACVMMFTMGRAEFPVDTHVLP